MGKSYTLVAAAIFFIVGSSVGPISARLTVMHAPAQSVTLGFRNGNTGLVVDLARHNFRVTYSVVNFRSAPDAKVRAVIFREFKNCRGRDYIPADNSDRDYLEDIAGCINTGIDSKKDGDFFIG